MLLNHKNIYFFICLAFNFIGTFNLIKAQFPVTFKSISGYTSRPVSIAVSDDSAYLVSGQSTNQFKGEVFKLNNNGDILWVRTLISPNRLLPLGFKQAKDGGYWIFGETIMHNSYPNGFICKLNACGNLEKGIIFSTEDYNYVFDIYELSNQKLLINQGGNAFNSFGQEYSFVGLFDFKNSNWVKQIIYPLGSTIKKIGLFKELFYSASSWYFNTQKDTSKYYIGSSFACYDSLLNFKYCKGLSAFDIDSNPKYFPQATSNTISLNSGKVLTGASLRGLNRPNNAQPAAILRLSSELDYLDNFDLNNDIELNWYEVFEFISQTDENNFLAMINVKRNYSSYFYKTYFYSLDSNLQKKKEISYGDTNLYSFRVFDFAKLQNKKNVALLELYNRTNNNAQYHIVKVNSDLSLDSSILPLKIYDSKCPDTIDSFGIINVFDFDTLHFTNQKNVIYFTEIQNINSSFNVSIFPNPATEYLKISLSQTQNVSISIFDFNGKQVLNKSFHNLSDIQIDVTQYPKGFYFIMINTLYGNYSNLILIQ